MPKAPDFVRNLGLSQVLSEGLAAVVVAVAAFVVVVVAVLGFPIGALSGLALGLEALSFETGALLGLAALLFNAELALSFFVACPLQGNFTRIFTLGAFVAGPFDGR